MSSVIVTEECPSRSLTTFGGARPKASVRDDDGHLAIAKFPRKDDENNTVVWEAVALELAASRLLDPATSLVDSGEATTAEVRSLLKEKNLARLTMPTGALERQLCDDLDHFYVTDAAERFARVAERFLGSKPSSLEAIEVWGEDRLVH